ncbi:EutN/CcmL family microcompartment protein [Brevibacillus daliensis]|uniref:EutN/CcmL family microcompartment protein n=1 Tax=Brevibacillus daliensis TaxID=2892995 RepID=UPI001E2AC225|nr:EutN/CcmL family microcompartment protein [Brevibacillus daliensis]
MFMAKVTGSIVSTKKDDSLVGKKLMVVQPIDRELQHVRHEEIAVDFVGAGVGDYVLLTHGTAARSVFEQPNVAIDATIIAIIDSFD